MVDFHYDNQPFSYVAVHTYSLSSRKFPSKSKKPSLIRAMLNVIRCDMSPLDLTRLGGFSISIELSEDRF